MPGTRGCAISHGSMSPRPTPSTPSGLAGLGSGEERSDRPELVPCGREARCGRRCFLHSSKVGFGFSIRVATKGRLIVPEPNPFIRRCQGRQFHCESSASGHCSLVTLASPEGGRNGCRFSRRLKTVSVEERTGHVGLCSILPSTNKALLPSVWCIAQTTISTPPSATKWVLIRHNSGGRNVSCNSANPDSWSQGSCNRS